MNIKGNGSLSIITTADNTLTPKENKTNERNRTQANVRHYLSSGRW